MLLRVVRFAYSRRIISSRAIARACEEQVTFIALSGDSRPYFTTIAHFVSTLGDQIAPIFAAVLAVCDRQGLIGREMFAIDGVRLPSNAFKHRSGTRADFARHATKMERAAEAMLARHRAEDAQAVEPSLLAKDVGRRERLVQDAAELRAWLARQPDDRRGATGAVRKSNRTEVLRPERPVQGNLARNPLPAASRFCSLVLKRTRTLEIALSYSFDAARSAAATINKQP